MKKPKDSPDESILKDVIYGLLLIVAIGVIITGIMAGCVSIWQAIF